MLWISMVWISRWSLRRRGPGASPFWRFSSWLWTGEWPEWRPHRWPAICRRRAPSSGESLLSPNCILTDQRRGEGFGDRLGDLLSVKTAILDENLVGVHPGHDHASQENARAVAFERIGIGAR